MGTFAVQLAKWCGATVIGTASQPHLALLRELGADEVIDYNTTRFEAAVQGVDVVLDTVGGETQARPWAVLKPGGILVSLVQPPSAETAAAHSVQACLIGAQPNAEQLTQIAGLVEHGQLKPVISSILPLQEVRQAHALSESRHTCGKIVLRVME